MSLSFIRPVVDLRVTTDYAQEKQGTLCVMALEPRPQQKQYDYLLKFLLVGDSDVGKQEILSGLEDGSSESPFCSGSGRCFIQ